MVIKRVISVFLLTLSLAFAQGGEDCADSLRELLKGNDVAQEKVREFLKLQSGITLHKLAYASVRSSGLEEEFRLEKKILDLLNQQMEKNKDDPELAKVHQLFHDPKNKVSRTALAKALPYIADLLNDQNNEQSEFERRYFNINQGDIKMLAILAQREEYANGQYASALWRDVNDDRSILNFTKIINSSIRTVGGPSQNMLDRMDKRIGELHARAIELLGELDISEACKRELAACVVSGNRGDVLKPELTSFLTELVDEVQLGDAHKHLRYDEVWLYVGKKNKKGQGEPANGSADANSSGIKSAKKRVSVKKEAPKVFVEPALDPDEVIHQHLLQKVLDHMPQLFSRDDLIYEREFTAALAKAIDEGILRKRGEERVFTYGSKSYYLPELWNSETWVGDGDKLDWAWNKVIQTGDSVGSLAGVRDLGRIVGDVGMDFFGFFGADFEEKYPEVKKEDIPDFLTTMYKQKAAFGHKFSFVYKDELYDIQTGEKIRPGAQEFLAKFQVPGKSSAKKPSPYAQRAEVKEEMARELIKGNSSVVINGKAAHISGAPVDFDREYARAKKAYEEADLNANGAKKFPSKEKIEKLMKGDLQIAPLTLKTLADRKRSFTSKGVGYDLFEGKIDRKAALSKLKTLRGDGLSAKLYDYDSKGDDFLIANTMAVLNQERSFTHDDKKYYASSGEVIAKEAESNRGQFYNFDQRQRAIAGSNEKTNLGVIIDYHRRFEDKSCDHFSVVDKESASLKVYKVKPDVSSVLWETQVLVGAAVGDEKTKHSGGVLGPVSNNKTAAGAFSMGVYENGQVPYLKILDGEDVSAAISQATTINESLLNDGDLGNNRVTNGSIMLGKADFERFKNQYAKKGCPFYILPEKDKVKLKIKQEELTLASVPGKTDGDYFLGETSKKSPQPIVLAPKDPKALNQTAKDFLKALGDNKSRIMTDLGITNEEYNQLAKLSFGILGVESQFGDGLKVFPDGFSVGNLLNPRRHKEKPYGGAIVFLGKLVTRGEFSIDPDERSRGLTQIKAVENYPHIKKFGGITRDNLMEPDKAAVATMYVLGEMLERLKKSEKNHQAITEENRMEYLYYLYNGQSRQISRSAATPELNAKARKVSAYANMLTVYSK